MVETNKPEVIDKDAPFREKGFKSEKEYKTFNSKALSLWKASHRQIIISIENLYDDELSKEEKAILFEDVELTQLIQLMKKLEQRAIDRIEEKLKEIRGGKEG